MLLFQLLCLIVLAASVASVVQQSATGNTESEERREDDNLGLCLEELSEAHGNYYDWISFNPSILVSLALNFNRTGSCRLDALLAESLYRDSATVTKWDFSGMKTTKTLDKKDDTLNLKPTPAPTGTSSPGTTVHITDEHDFALLLPSRRGGMKDAFFSAAARVD